MSECKEGEGAGAARKGGGEEAPPVREEEEEKVTHSVVPPKPLGVRIKQEPSDDIKDFAETTMNELLGWYGYTDKVDQQDTAQLTLTSYRPSSTSPAARRPKQRRDGDDRNQGDVDDDDDDDVKAGEDKVNGDDKGNETDGGVGVGGGEGRETRTSDSGDSEQDTGRLSVDSSEQRLSEHHRNLVTAFSKTREGKGGGGNEEGGAQYIVCAWCQKTGMKLFTLRTPAGSKAFCSEVCFTQCRRASFKKNKVCDWCKHVRHTVNFVDFQDGENQLQFCSEKCLNQYKMNIFCTETQEHLKQIQSQLNEERKNAALSPGGASSSMSSKGVSDAASASSAAKKIDEQILITPELWLAKHKDKIPKTEIVDVEEETKEEAEKDRKKEARTSEGRERRGESQSSDRSRGRELLDRKRTSLPLSAAGAAAAAAAVASYTNSLQLNKSGARLVPGSERVLERSSRDRERVRRLFRDSGGDRESRPLPHPSDSPASSSQFSPPSRPHTSDRGTPPMVPPMLLPHLNGLGAGIAGLGMFNPLLCSSLFGPVSADGRHDTQRAPLSHADRDRKEENGTRARSGDRVSLSSTPGAVHSSSSPANTASSSGTPNPPQTQHPPPPPFPPTVAPLNGPAGFPQGLHPSPFMLGMPPFACPPGFFPPDPAAMMGGLLALQGTHPTQPAPPPLHQQQPQQRDRALPQRPRADSEVPLSATAGCLNAGVPPVTVMMPFPIVLPIPVPIPIPLPIAPEKMQQFFKERDHAVSGQPPPPPPASRKTSSSTDRHATRSHSPRDRDRDSVGSHHSTHSHFLNHSHNSSHNLSQGLPQQRPDSVSSDSSCHSPGLSASHRTTPTRCHEVNTPGCLSCMTYRMFPRPGRQSIDSIMALRKNRESADSIMTLRRESARTLMVGESVSPSLPPSLSPAKRSLTPVFPVTLDLSKRARLDENRNNEDEAIDLSKDSRSSTPARSVTDFSVKSSHPSALTNGALSSSSSSNSNGSVASGKENQQVEHDMASIDGESEAGLKVPKIHIIDSRDDPPLAQPLPLPPADHAYSMRRSLILDAPSVPKPPRSPSPERRYVRTVPRDMVEAAKRRCLRARVRTK